MKRSIRILAALVGISMLAGCASEETKKKKKDKKEKETTEETEMTSDEETSGTSETTGETTEETTSETTEETTSEPTAVTDPFATGVPGYPELDSDQGKVSRQMYEDFMIGEQLVDITTLEWIEPYALFYDVSEIPDQPVKISDMVEFFYSHSMRQDDSYEKSVSYGYLDAGLDGDPELAIRLEGLGEFTSELVIKNIDGQLVLTGVYDSWSRNYCVVENTGVVCENGSGGAALHVEQFGVIDAEGNYNRILIMEEFFSYFMDAGEGLEDLQAYADSLGDDNGIVLAVIEFEDEDFVYTIIPYDDPYKIDEEAFAILEAAGYETTTYQEVIDKLKASFDSETVFPGSPIEYKPFGDS